MNADSTQVRGLRNLGNTCFLNCILQALAPSNHLISYLRQAIRAFGPDAPDIAIALMEALEDLAPIPHARCCPPVSASPLLAALRKHVRADVLTDGEQNDAVEALEVLLGTLLSQLQSVFLHARGPELTSLSAWHAISNGAEHQGQSSRNALTQLQAARSAPCTDSAQRSDSQQGRSIEDSGAMEVDTSHPEDDLERSTESNGAASSFTIRMQASSSARPDRLVYLQLKVAEGRGAVTATLAVTASDTIGAATSSTADEQGQREASYSTQHAPQQARMPAEDSMLQAWRALSRLPLELSLQHEAACARCRRPCASHVSAMLALPLTLPSVEGQWGPVLKPGATLHHALAAYFSRNLVQDAVCTHCSLRASLEQAPPASIMRTASQPSAGLCALANGASQTIKLCTETVSSSSQGAVDEKADTCPHDTTRGSDSSSCQGLSRGGVEVEGAAEKLARLRGLLRGGCAPPDCDYMQLATEVGLPWSERRAPLLTRTVLARAPQVLCLQLRRVLWTRRGQLAKVHGRVAFTEELDLMSYTAAAAEPLLPVARPLVSHPLFSLSQSHCAPAHAHPSMRSRAMQDHHAAGAPIAAPSHTRTCSHRRCSNGNVSAVPEGAEQNCSCSTVVGPANGGALASAAAEDVRKQSGAAVQHSWKPNPSAAMPYRLAAVIVHHGGAQSGHYTVYRKASLDQDDCYVHAKAANQQGLQQQAVDFDLDYAFERQVSYGGVKSNWVHASDEEVRSATVAEVLSSEAAVLLYERAPQ